MRRLARRFSSSLADEPVNAVKLTERGLWIARASNPFWSWVARTVDRVSQVLPVGIAPNSSTSKHSRIFTQAIGAALEGTPYKGRAKLYPRVREGGVFAYFPDSTMREGALEVMERNSTLKAHKVVGSPYLEDLLSTTPSRMLSIKRADAKSIASVTEESLFKLLRPYGRISMLWRVDDKEWRCIYSRHGSSVAARSCVNNVVLEGDVPLFLTYEAMHWTWINKMVGNPRIFLPLLAVLGTLGTWLLIDPARYVSMATSISRVERRKEHHAWDSLPSSDFERRLLKALSEAPRKEVTLGLHGPVDILDIVTDRVTTMRPFVVHVDMSTLREDNLSQFVEEFSSQVGFAPSFQRLSSFFGWLQQMVPGLSTPKSDGGGNLAAMEQLRDITKMAKSIINNVLASTYPSDPNREFPYCTVLCKLPPRPSKVAQELCTMLIESNLNAHVIFVGDSLRAIRAVTGEKGPRAMLSSQDLAQEEVERMLHDTLETDARGFITVQVKRTASASGMWGSLTDALYAQLRRLFTLTRMQWEQRNASQDDDEDDPAEEHLTRKASNRPKGDLDEVIARVYAVMGGRLSDIAAFVESMRNCEGQPEEVIQEMVAKRREEFLRESFSGGLKLSNKCGEHPWTQEQVWLVVQQLLKGSATLDAILYGVLKGDSDAFDGMLAQGLVRIDEETPERSLVVLGSPLLYHALDKLPPVLTSKMEALLREKKEDDLKAKMKAVEEEQVLGQYNPERWRQLRSDMVELTREMRKVKQMQ